MFEAVSSDYRVPFDGSFRIGSASTDPPGKVSKKRCVAELDCAIEELKILQQKLYAQDRYAVLLVFQAMDAAGKDGTIRAVMSGINPAGCQVYSFKQPSREELDHDFLWRTKVRLPERGRIGIFNRSYYEEVLAVRVHPEFLEKQRLPIERPLEELWQNRFTSIRAHEEHMARSGTVVLKFWLNVSRKEQRKRFLARIDDPRKNWKFSSADIEERQHWGAYMEAYEDALNATSRPWAPWYAVPADDKPYMRLQVARIVCDSLKSLDLRFPELAADEKARLADARRRLEKEKG